jgi:hypothetical protein
VSNLRSTLNHLASSFADSVLAAIRTASLDELVGETNGAPRRGPGRPRSTTGQSAPVAPRAPTKSGRLARRSPEEIAKTLGLVVAALKGSKGKGMRSEEIRKFLSLDVREVPRVLGEGLKTKKLKSKGQKRATTYFAA